MPFPKIACRPTVVGFLCPVFFVLLVSTAWCDAGQLLHPSDQQLLGTGSLASVVSASPRPAIVHLASAKRFHVSEDGVFLRNPVSRASAVNVEVRIPEDLDELEKVRNADDDFDLDRLSIGVGMEVRF